MADTTLLQSETAPDGNGKQPTVIKGVLERIVWSKDRRIIAIVKPLDRREITVIGDMFEPQTGQLYEFTGRWKYNQRFGKFDLALQSYRTILPDDNAGIFHYLVRVAKWVGPDTAERLIERYGDDTLQILKTDPERVARDGIRGLTPERCTELADTLRQNEKLEAAMIEVGNLIGNVLGQRAVEKAIGRWGADAAHIVRHDAYRLTELDGIGFIRADGVYLKTGGRPEALKRHGHAVLHVLAEEASQHGHTRIAPLRLHTELAKIIQAPHPKALTLCARAKRVLRADDYIALRNLADAERFIADKLTALRFQELPPLQVNDEVRLHTATLEDDQLNAFLRSQTEPLLAIVGAPGTGKTYTVARILALWQANNLNVALAAPTGKAAKQMELALAATVGLPARTIHSLLEAEVVDGEFGFKRNQDNKLDCNALVIDETSMVDVNLMQSLLKAVPDECRVLFVGDHYQLPSVGPGAVLRDILAAQVPYVELRVIKRNAGTIVRACHAIKDGSLPVPDERLDLEQGRNWRHLDADSPAEILAIVEKLLRETLPARGVDPVWQTQIISPTNESGPLSCKVLNRTAKEVLNPSKYPERLPFAVGDKIVRTKNGTAVAHGSVQCAACDGSGTALDKGFQRKCLVCCGTGSLTASGEIRIVNGDIGVVKELDKEYIYVDFLYPNRSVRIPRKEHHLRMAYCMTCHKMQGSEVGVVILPLTAGLLKIPLLTREWIYTAFSRAKSFIITIGRLSHLPVAIARVGNTARLTSLAGVLTERLRV